MGHYGASLLVTCHLSLACRAVVLTKAGHFPCSPLQRFTIQRFNDSRGESHWIAIDTRVKE
jgi:hypothetical protein